MAVYSSSTCVPSVVPSSVSGKKIVNLLRRNKADIIRNVLEFPKIDVGAGLPITCVAPHPLRGSLDKSVAVFTKNFLITSYQIDYYCKASMRAIMNMLQDTVVDHYKSAGISVDGFGITEEMRKRDLIWVFCRMHILVLSYPLWDDIIEIQSFLSRMPGKNSMLVEWVVRSHATGQILIRANCKKLTVNKKTRKIQKIINEVEEEIRPHLVDTHQPVITDNVGIKLRPFDADHANHVQSGLRAEWGDLDLNKHVNNAKYIEWVLKSVPSSIMDSHDLSEFIIDFKKECSIESVVQSSTKYGDDHANTILEMDHLLLHQSSASQVALAKTTWTPKLNHH